ncbi:MAG TPA: hypothetical protein VMX15_06340 [Candidatus Heimdallarchaeota archaeon]|nr:hypothetical protein [Candidatus Heimdallarchaeota archaeon]
MKLTIYGAPRTKKNHGYVAVTTDKLGRKRRTHQPSKAWQKWAKTAVIETSTEDRDVFGVSWGAIQISVPVNCCAIFYCDRKSRTGKPISDAVGHYQGLADLLERRGIVADDCWIVSWDGSRVRYDKDNPRVEVELVPVEES